MPLYDYRCPACGVFERTGGLEEREVTCTCGQQATRLPYSGLPQIKGETVAKSIPDPAYRTEAMKRELNQTWGDATKSKELIRAAVREDSEGNKYVDTPSIK